MRTRAVLVILLALVLSVLSACSQEAGPMPKGHAQDPGPGALNVKLDALMVDDCFRFPGEVHPPDCQKYVTQLGSIPETALRYAGNNHPRLVDAAHALTTGINSYRAQRCDRDGGGGACAATLTDIATALEQIKGPVSELADAATPAS